jgi:hypothetical protein
MQITCPVHFRYVSKEIQNVSETYFILICEKYKKFAVVFRGRWKEICLIMLYSDTRIITQASVWFYCSVLLQYHFDCIANKVRKANVYVCDFFPSYCTFNNSKLKNLSVAYIFSINSIFFKNIW